MGNFDDLNLFDCPDVAIRLKYKIALFDAVEKEFRRTAENQKTYPKGYLRTKTKSIMKDLKSGLKIINKKNPLYVEMPKLEPVANGQVKQVYEKTDNTGDDEIFVNLPAGSEIKRIKDIDS